MSLDVLMSIVNFVLIICVLVVAHEAGHFFAARMCKMNAEEFAVGMGPIAVKLGRWQDTLFTIRWLPLGGFVRISGMQPEDEPLPGTFNSRPLIQRAWVVFAGPLMSFIAGYVLIFGVATTAGLPDPKQKTNVVSSIGKDSPADKAKLQYGDRLTAINDVPTPTWTILSEQIRSHPGQEVTLKFERKGQPQEAKAALLTSSEISAVSAAAAQAGFQANDVLIEIGKKDVSNTAEIAEAVKAAGGKPVTVKLARLKPGEEAKPHTERERQEQPVTLNNIDPALFDPAAKNLTFAYGQLGFSPESRWVRYGVLGALKKSGENTVNMIGSIARLFKNRSEIKDNVGGPIAIGTVTHRATQRGFATVVLFAASLSVSLGFMNLLPIPVLDGGYLLLFLIEWLRGGRKLSPQAQVTVQYVGLAMIALIFISVMYLDIGRLITGKMP